MFPALVNCCTLDWFTAWPEQALRSVASYFLGDVDIEEDVKAGVVDVCVDMQERVSGMAVKYVAEMQRHYYVTPTSYLELINTFHPLSLDSHTLSNRHEVNCWQLGSMLAPKNTVLNHS